MLGRPIFCPTCGSGLWQPTAPPAAAPVMAYEPPPVQVVPAQHWPAPAPTPRVVYLDTEEPRSPVFVLAALTLGLILFAALAAMMYFGSGWRLEKSTKRADGPPPTDGPAFRPDADPPARHAETEPPRPPAKAADDDGKSWDLNRLWKHLQSKGVQCNAAERMAAARPGLWLTRGEDAVLVQQFPDHASALAASPVGRNESSFAWNRFLVSGRPGTLYQDVRAALSP
jgi:hypothetical protein